ncbi:MAG: hypothetical protein OEZ65_09510 [Gemmatimonadota bacterium]|nr:hypothetical protein [Gemmatimonadota bacterium]MDH5759812.1 hypothetical protein [Gemmatimonadota bacterium]
MPPPEEVLHRNGAVSDQRERDRLLAAIMSEAAHLDERLKGPTPDIVRPAWKGLAATFLFLLAGYYMILPPRWVRPPAPAAPSAAVRADGIRRALVMQAAQVEAFRLASQRLPDSLEEVGAIVPDILYVRSNSRVFQLVATLSDGSPMIFDSADPDPEFDAILRSILVATGQ